MAIAPSVKCARHSSELGQLIQIADGNHSAHLPGGAHGLGWSGKAFQNRLLRLSNIFWLKGIH
jgi:hypothetical protein